MVNGFCWVVFFLESVSVRTRPKPGLLIKPQLPPISVFLASVATHSAGALLRCQASGLHPFRMPLARLNVGNGLGHHCKHRVHAARQRVVDRTRAARVRRMQKLRVLTRWKWYDCEVFGSHGASMHMFIRTCLKERTP